jgi:hypothetical protein
MSKIEINKNPFFNKDLGMIDENSSGITMTFNNGNTISIQWGMSNYSSTRTVNKPTPKCTSAEVAIWDENDKWARIDETESIVKGWVEPDEIAKLIFITSTNTISEINSIFEKEFSTVK